MHGFHQIGRCRQGLSRGRVLGRQQGSALARWRLPIEALLPGQVILQVTLDPRDGMELWAGGRSPSGPHIVGPLQARRGVGATGIHAAERDAMRKRRRERVDDEREPRRIPSGPLQDKPLARGRGHGAGDVEPVKGVLDPPYRVDLAGGQPSATHRPSPDATVVLAPHTHRAGMRRWHGAPPQRCTGRLQRRNGRRGFVYDGAAGPCVWP
jgi:hypothetical protein